ncbi:GHMP kinase [Sphingobium chlorophenolicum L-1]|uniref:GHMP kinase n=1 Tax=Sphingobium chlorophenolicum L-1 TaxID=690566 RepID=F6F0M9_SPHCR|nr:GHMP kinase [Sphingobium chlorophenolicum]AEG50351.1 GHMP kinase [Sphingobium chlorophenolicum L-1]
MTNFTKIRARAPLRLGLAGGGTDLSPYCDEFGGAVLNVTIDRFAFASILPRDDGKIILRADDLNITEAFDLDAPLVSEKLKLHALAYDRMVRDFNGGQRIAMTIATTVDAPPGSGLGSSSALVVALVDALRLAINAPLGPYDVAQLAFEIERIDAGLAGGRQDQYAAAFGGVNFIEFTTDARVIVNPLRVSDAILKELESSIVICFSGRSRKSADIIERQTSGISSSSSATLDGLHQLKNDAQSMKAALLSGKIDDMAEILTRSWNAKRSTAQGISNSRIDELMQIAIECGALGGKVSGAGGGGFIFFLVHPEQRFGLIEKLSAAGASATPVMFTHDGSHTWQF